MNKQNDSANFSEPLKKSGLFGPTDWNQLRQFKTASDDEQLAILDVLARKYWTPIFQYLLLSGNNENEAQDLTQEFFEYALKTKLFSKANPQLGRFRNFLLASLKHYLANKNRKETAQKRRPKEGIASLDQLAYFGYFQPKSLVEKQTPETIFHHLWLREVVRNTLEKLEQDFNAKEQKTHFALFRTRVVAPELEGVEPPPLKQQADEFGLDYKEAANQIETAKRAFLRFLKKEVRAYVGSKEEVSEEEKDILSIFQLEARS